MEINKVEGYVATGFFNHVKPMLLLLRGLIAGGLLAFAFGQKRWRVNYGLTPTRVPPTRMAVPYTAKDNPSARSEFSHPDVVIVLTSLSYYYSGLEDEDLFVALGHLLRSDQADAEFQMWVQDAPSTPLAFTTLRGINLKDRHQCQSAVWPHLRHAKAAIDYFQHSLSQGDERIPSQDLCIWLGHWPGQGQSDNGLQRDQRLLHHAAA